MPNSIPHSVLQKPTGDFTEALSIDKQSVLVFLRKRSWEYNSYAVNII